MESAIPRAASSGTACACGPRVVRCLSLQPHTLCERLLGNRVMAFSRVKSLDELPENFRPHYVQVGEEWLPDIADFEQHPRMQSSRKLIDQLRREKDETMRALVPFRDAGITLEKWEALQKAAQGMESQEVGQRTKELMEQHARDLDKLSKEKAKLRQELDTTVGKWKRDKLTSVLLSAIAEAECERTQSEPILRYLLNPRFDEPRW